jgi:hypothetical protein
MTTNMTSQEFSLDRNVEDGHESEVVQQTTEYSYDIGQVRRRSERALAALAASPPIFERSPAPSPPPSEERNAFQEAQRAKDGTLIKQNHHANKKQQN